MLASFVACRRAPDDFLLVCSRDLLAPTLKRLSMFVLRAKAKLERRDGGRTGGVGLLGSAASSIADSADSAGAESQFDTPFVAVLPPADGAARALWLAPAGTPGARGRRW
jgi:folate-binding Fe-S cluster repair protein YgfZ